MSATTPRSATLTIAKALRILKDEVESEFGIVEGLLSEAADRLEELHNETEANKKAKQKGTK